MKQHIIISLLLLTGLTRVSAQLSQPVIAEELKSWCYYLASDEMKGRMNGSPEMKVAAEYIASVFKSSGIRPVSKETGYFQEYTIKRGETEIPERNVIGMLEGSDSLLKKEWIILSAHFDHIGIRKPVNGDSIYNGADDNASGTATVMELARILGSHPARPGRSILFVCYSGEEAGLKGSRYFAEHSVIPLDQVKLNLNFEMEGECATLGKHRYILTGYQFTDFDDLLDRYNQNSGWEVARTYKSPDWIFKGSDNASLAIRKDGEKSLLNIPAFTVVTTDSIGIIHKPNDEPQKMDYENMASLAKYCTGLVLFLSVDPLILHWDQEAFDKYNKRQP